jgi:hypothetical protein
MCFLVRALALLVACSSLACRYELEVDDQGKFDWKPAAPVKLSLSVVGQPRPERVVVRLTVTNDGTDPIVWDSAFTLFLQWRVQSLEGAWVATQDVSEVKPPTPDEVARRFVSIGSGHTLSKDFELTKAFRIVTVQSPAWPSSCGAGRPPR